ncbi:MAG: XRE family transcriptional regulator [Magnetococcales bacterium]|nr:XRE family transcriptional regulator [Magnetococcales bacterium]
MNKQIEAEQSSGNIFADLGLPDSDELFTKTKLALQISQIIKHRKLKQKEAAGILGIDQPKVSAILGGKLTGFTLERLFKFLNLLGQDVEIVVKNKPTSHSIGHTFVAHSVEEGSSASLSDVST